MKRFWILAIALTFLSVPCFAAPPGHGGHGHHGGGMRGGGMPHASAVRPVAHGGGAMMRGSVHSHGPAGRPGGHIAGHPPIGRPPIGHRPPMPPRIVHRHRPIHPIIIPPVYRPYYSYRPYYYYSAYYSPYYYDYPYEGPYYYDSINTTANVINAAAAAATAVRLWTW